MARSFLRPQSLPREQMIAIVVAILPASAIPVQEQRGWLFSFFCAVQMNIVKDRVLAYIVYYCNI